MIFYFKWSSSFKSHNWFIDDTVATFLPVLIICSILSNLLKLFDKDSKTIDNHSSKK
jgi:hypothetical protein